MSLLISSPSARVIAEAGQTRTVKDEEGRILEVRRPGALDRLRLFKAVGPVLAENERYLGYAMLAMCVGSIDGVPVPQPANESQLEALVARLGDAGLVAAGRAMAPAGEEVADADAGN